MLSCTLDEETAQQRAEYLFETLKSEEYELTTHHYVSSFFHNSSKEEYKLFLNYMTSKLGKIEDYQLENVTKKYEILDQNHIILNYRISHTKFKSRHTLIVVKENGKYLVAWHNIDSDALDYDDLPESLQNS